MAPAPVSTTSGHEERMADTTPHQIPDGIHQENTMTIHLARIGIDPQALRTYAAMTRTGDDDGLYATHHALRKMFGDNAPQPFHAVLSGPEPHVVGYLDAKRAGLLASTEGEGDVVLRRVFSEPVRTREMPVVWEDGARLSFRLRGRPVVRYSDEAADLVEKTTGWRPPAEVDVVVAASRKTGTPADPSETCRAWLERRLGDVASVETFVLKDYRQVSSRRSSHGPDGRILVPGPDATMAGILTVGNGEEFGRMLAKGIGRHCAFGYGMMMVSRTR